MVLGQDQIPGKYCYGLGFVEGCEREKERRRVKDESRLQRSIRFWAREPRALPWAGMKQAVGLGVKCRSAFVKSAVFWPS
jgi:hypothetical protein